MWVGLKLVHETPTHNQSQGSVEQVNSNIEDIVMWLKSNSTTYWGDGLQFVQVLKNRAYHEGIKCSLYEAMFRQPLKVGLKTSNLPDDAIEDTFTKKELEIAVSGEHGNGRNKLTEEPIEEIHVETPNGTTKDLVDNVTEVSRSPSMCVKRKNKIIEKTKTVKSNLETKSFKMARLSREKFPQGTVGDTVKVRVPVAYLGRCDSRWYTKFVVYT